MLRGYILKNFNWQGVVVIYTSFHLTTLHCTLLTKCVEPCLVCKKMLLLCPVLFQMDDNVISDLLILHFQLYLSFSDQHFVFLPFLDTIYHKIF
jgi:hypothetical protein